MVLVNVNVNVVGNSLFEIPMSSVDFAIYTFGIWTIPYGLISPWENSAHFLQLIVYTYA